MSLKGTNNAEKIWNFLSGKNLTAYGIAGLMGNLYAESALIPTNLQNSYEKSLGMTDVEYTAAVDSGSYGNFVRDSAGYGLAQWTYWSRKEALLNYAKAAGKSIGDLEMQLGYLWKELQGYTAVLKVLKSATTVREASDVVLKQFERPADQSEAACVRRASYGQKYFDQYASTAPQKPAASGSCTVARLLQIAAAEIGYKEKASNSQLDDKEANAGNKDWTKYARDLYAAGYYNGNKNGYAWCDVFVDWCFYQLAGRDAKKAQQVECQTGPYGAGCGWSLSYYKEQGRYFTENPQPGDQIFFTSGGSVSHTGIVESVNGSTIVTIEGNASNMVKRINRKMHDGYTLGFGRPKYDGAGTVTPPAQDPEPEKPTQPATDLKVGDIVEYTGTVHYASANASTGPSCKPGKAKVTALYPSGKHPVHLIAISGGGSTVYGWVDTALIAKDEPEEKWVPKVGDIVDYKGSTHYTSANASTPKGCKGGKAKITQIYRLGKSRHPYHLIRVSGSGATVYGWVDEGSFVKA